jgi:hypothetical protein
MLALNHGMCALNLSARLLGCAGTPRTAVSAKCTESGQLTLATVCWTQQPVHKHGCCNLVETSACVAVWTCNHSMLAAIAAAAAGLCVGWLQRGASSPRPRVRFQGLEEQCRQCYSAGCPLPTAGPGAVDLLRNLTRYSSAVMASQVVGGVATGALPPMACSSAYRFHHQHGMPLPGPLQRPVGKLREQAPALAVVCAPSWACCLAAMNVLPCSTTCSAGFIVLRQAFAGQTTTAWGWPPLLWSSAAVDRWLGWDASCLTLALP